VELKHTDHEFICTCAKNEWSALRAFFESYANEEMVYEDGDVDSHFVMESCEEGSDTNRHCVHSLEYENGERFIFVFSTESATIIIPKSVLFEKTKHKLLQHVSHKRPDKQ
jgi:hypothetical protein